MTYYQPGPQVAEYRVVEATDTFYLQQAVSELLREGFTPHGSLAVMGTDVGWSKFYQPMVKYHPPVQYATACVTTSGGRGG